MAHISTMTANKMISAINILFRIPLYHKFAVMARKKYQRQNDGFYLLRVIVRNRQRVLSDFPERSEQVLGV